MKNRTVVFLVLLLVLLLVGGALWLVGAGPSPTADPTTRGGPSDTDPAQVEDEPTVREKTASGRTARWRRRGKGVLTAKLLEYGTKKPVGGVDVVLEAGLPGPNELHRTTSTAEGRVRFDDVTNFDEWTLIASPAAPLAEARLVGVAVTENQETDLGVIYLNPEFSVPGIVLDEMGAPIEGAEVRAVRSQPVEVRTDVFRIVRDLPFPQPAIDTELTGPDGRFAFTKLVPGTYDMEADADGFQLVVERDVIVTPQADKRELRIVLPTGFTLKGRVIRTDGGPLEGLPVVTFEEPGDDLAQLVLDKRFATTDKEGLFTLEGLGAGEYMVAVTPEGQPFTLVNRIPIPAKKFVELIVGGDAWLEGTISGDGGQPISQADVYVVNLDQSTPMIGHAVTDGEGYYRIDGLKSGPIQLLMVQAEGYGAYPPDFLQRLIRQTTQFTLKPGPNRQDIPLAAGGTVRGVVLDREAETPIADVRIALRSPRSFFGGTRSATTDAEGKFEITSVPLGSTILSAEKEGWFQPGVGPQTIQQLVMKSMQGSATDQGRGSVITIAEAGQVIEREVKLVRGTTVGGVVVNPEDEPVEGARVSLEFEPLGNWMDQVNPLFPLGEPRLTDAEGRFTLPSPPPGQKVRLVAKAQGYLDGVQGGIQVQPGKTKDDFVVKLRQGATLEGKVTDKAGRPIPGAQIRYVQGEGDNEWSLRFQLRRAKPSNSGDDGTFRVTQVENGTLLVQISHPQYLSKSQSGVAAAEGRTVRIDMTLEKAPSLSGKVIGADGRPFVGARINYNLKGARPEGVDRTHSNPRSPLTDSNGRFLIEGVIPGTYALTADAEGAAPSDAVEVQTGGPPVTLTLKKAYVIGGHVRSSDGRPLAGIQVNVLGDGGRDVRTGPDGEFEIRDVPAGTYDVRAQLRGSMEGESNVQPKTVKGVEAGTESLLIELDAGLSIMGTVIDVSGKAVASGWAWCNRIRSREEDRAADVNQWGPIIDGKFTLSGLSEGEYNVGISGMGSSSLTMRAKAGDHDVRIDLSVGGVIRGRLLLADGKPAASVGVYANSATNSSYNAQTDADGRFEFRGLAAGTYSVGASHQIGSGDAAQWYQASETGIELIDGGSEQVDLQLAKP